MSCEKPKQLILFSLYLYNKTTLKSSTYGFYSDIVSDLKLDIRIVIRIDIVYLNIYSNECSVFAL